MHSFKQVKELLQMHENMLLNVFNNTIDRLDKKIDTLMEENSKIKKEFIRHENLSFEERKFRKKRKKELVKQEN